METALTKKYGLFTAIAMVVGIVIGSGVFLKQRLCEGYRRQHAVRYCRLGIVGLIMIVCSYTFAIAAQI